MLAGVASYLSWGFVPIYFKAIKSVSALETLGHRIIWSCILLGIAIAVLRRWNAVVAAVCDRRTLLAVTGSTALIAANWLLYIWAVTNNQVLAGSLGYFINPLLSVLLGVLFLGERLRRPQWLAVATAVIGVVVFTIGAGRLPMVALGLAGTFALYGLLRKQMKADAIIGLTIETGLLAPFGVAYMLYLWQTGSLAFGSQSTLIDILLCGSGIVTTIPLLLFATAARRVSLSTLGFLQYLAPSLQFMVGLTYGEHLNRWQWAGFAIIWTALAIFTIEAARRREKRG